MSMQNSHLKNARNVILPVQKTGPSQAVFKCQQCGHTTNADHNAARNILARAVSETGSVVSPRKTRPTKILVKKGPVSEKSELVISSFSVPKPSNADEHQCRIDMRV